MDKLTNDLLELLRQHEEAIADIYAAFHERLPSMAALWSQLVTEEKSHAMVITMISKAIGNDKLHLNTHKFKIQALQTAIDYIYRQANNVRDQGTTPLKALSLAIDLESAMIEREFFSVFETDSPVIKREFKALQQHTIAHQQMLQRMFDNERNKQDS